MHLRGRLPPWRGGSAISPRPVLAVAAGRPAGVVLAVRPGGAAMVRTGPAVIAGRPVLADAAGRVAGVVLTVWPVLPVAIAVDGPVVVAGRPLLPVAVGGPAVVAGGPVLAVAVAGPAGVAVAGRPVRLIAARVVVRPACFVGTHNESCSLRGDQFCRLPAVTDWSCWPGGRA